MGNHTLTYLQMPLPEDVEKLKGYGDFEAAIALIDQLLKQELPDALQKKLEVEKEILKILPTQYPYSFSEAMAFIKKDIPDFQEEELFAYQQNGAADWILIKGEVHFQDRFFACLLKTKPELAARVIHSSICEEQAEAQAYLDENVRLMKEKGGRTFHIHLKTGVELKEHAIKAGETIRVHLPLPKFCKQVRKIEILETVPKAKAIADEDALQRTAYFEAQVLPEHRTFTVEYAYDNHVDYVLLDPKEAIFEQPSFYTQEEAPHIRFTPYIRALAEELVGEEKNPVIKARKIYNFITTKIQYTFMREYFTVENISEYAAVNLKGDCGVQALLFITLCRCVGIPARWQSGMFVTPYTVGNHDWAQFYIAPYGWVFADCSFGGSAYRKGKLERWDYYFGNLDPFRMPANSEFQAPFVPDKSFLRIDPYDNQRGECEYAGYGLRLEDFEVIRERISMVEVDEMQKLKRR